jgi:glucose/arabinose dehydrogenase
MFRNARHRRRAWLEGVELETRANPVVLPAGFADTPLATGFNRPTAMEFAPDGRLFVLEQAGNVVLVHPDGTTSTALHLNVDSNGERGLLGIAFDPNFTTNHYAYLYYTNPQAGASSWSNGVHNQLSRFTVDDTDPLLPTFGNEAPILDWDNLSSATNHNGGAIHFGLDGMLYANAGDNMQTFTGPDGNVYRASQSLNNLLGKQLRIDVASFNSGVATRDDTTVGQLIPADNPFVGTAPGINQLIFALGLRNPYTFAVQPGTGAIFLNDVGETTWEEIHQSVAGANFGWRGGSSDGFGHPPPAFAAGTYKEPLLAYRHSGGPAGGGSAIVGGTFYNPTTSQFPASYVGKYFYEDLGFGWIRYFDPANPGSAANPDPSTVFATDTAGGLRDLKVDSAGNLFYLSGGDGTVHRISYQAPPNAGLTATYWDNIDFTGPSITRTDPTVDFNFGAGAPDPAIGAETFSARWVGHIVPRFTQTYRFFTTSDDGVRLWVNGKLIVNAWTDHPAQVNSGVIALVAGQRYDIRVDYFERAGDAVVKVEWRSARQRREVVPTSQLAIGPPVGTIQVNFQSGNSVIVPGVNGDSGAAFGDRGNGLSYGWNQDNTANAHNANFSLSQDGRYDSFAQMQAPTNPHGFWEIAVPNGTYQVRVIMGDVTGATNARYRLDVEGTRVVNRNSRPAARQFFTGMATITVTDGLLTLTSGKGAINNKIAFLEITPI